MASKRKTSKEFQAEIDKHYQDIAELKRGKAEALKYEKQQAAEQMLNQFQKAFNTDGKEMDLEDLLSFVQDNINKAKDGFAPVAPEYEATEDETAISFNN